jgi:ankyrin repeat protein
MNKQWVFQACQDGDLESLKQYITRDNVNEDILFSETAIETCTINSHIACIRWFIDMGADFKRGLLQAVILNKLECIRFYLSYHPDLNDPFQYGKQTTLHLARTCEAAKMLLQGKANVDARDYLNRPPLAIALGRKHDDLARLFMYYGARIDTNMYSCKWIKPYEYQLEDERKKFNPIAHALLCVLKKKKIPKDLAMHILTHMVLPEDFTLYRRCKRFRYE